MKIAVILCFVVSTILVVNGNPIDIRLFQILEETIPSTNISSPIAEEFEITDFINATGPNDENSASLLLQGKCDCAVFNTKIPVANNKAVITQSPIDVTCDAEGEEICLKLCTALAKSAHKRGPQLLCSFLGHFNQLWASVHSSTCGTKNWIYTGVSSPNEICCHDYQVVDCNDVIDNQSINPV